MPPLALVPAYRIQLPTRRRVEVVMMAGLGPPLLRVKITTLRVRLSVSINRFQVPKTGGDKHPGLNLRASDTESEEVTSAHPIDGALRNAEMLSRSS